MQQFEGKVAVVTGAASGIGRALAIRFAREGMKVVLADLEGGALESAEREVAAEGAETLAMLTDVASAEQVDELARAAVERFGRIDVACNNAGVLGAGLSWEASVADYEWILGVNTWGVIHGVRTFVPIMLSQGSEAHVVNTASMAALTTLPYCSIYHMSKHAVLALSECLHHELALKGAKVKVSVLCPEAVSTNIHRADRNRPAHMASPAPSEETRVVADAMREAMKAGVDPAEMADRVVQAIRDERFYILSNDWWREACHTRLDDIRTGRNPTLSLPE